MRDSSRAVIDRNDPTTRAAVQCEAAGTRRGRSGTQRDAADLRRECSGTAAQRSGATTLRGGVRWRGRGRDRLNISWPGLRRGAGARRRFVSVRRVRRRPGRASCRVAPVRPSRVGSRPPPVGSGLPPVGSGSRPLESVGPRPGMDQSARDRVRFPGRGWARPPGFPGRPGVGIRWSRVGSAPGIPGSARGGNPLVAGGLGPRDSRVGPGWESAGRGWARPPGFPGRPGVGIRWSQVGSAPGIPGSARGGNPLVAGGLGPRDSRVGPGWESAGRRWARPPGFPGWPGVGIRWSQVGSAPGIPGLARGGNPLVAGGLGPRESRAGPGWESAGRRWARPPGIAGWPGVGIRWSQVGSAPEIPGPLEGEPVRRGPRSARGAELPLLRSGPAVRLRLVVGPTGFGPGPRSVDPTRTLDRVGSTDSGRLGSDSGRVRPDLVHRSGACCRTRPSSRPRHAPRLANRDAVSRSRPARGSCVPAGTWQLRGSALRSVRVCCLPRPVAVTRGARALS